MTLNSAIFLLICCLTGGVLVAVITVVDRLVRPFRQQLQSSNGPQEQPIGYHLNPIDGALITSDTDCIAPISEACEAAAEGIEDISEGPSTAVETGIEAIAGFVENLPSS